ncbi:hypothetical protein [Streptomyces sp. CA-106131]|uniref:hypothetical protein n=1 Tax=Streptomyces sp. CA-106131 TaxID=3240045 RepID=UPI003D8EB425
MSTVHVRIGEHRTKYHTDADCPSLNGKQDTYMGQESMSEAQAKETEAHSLPALQEVAVLAPRLSGHLFATTVPVAVTATLTATTADGSGAGQPGTVAAECRRAVPSRRARNF